MKKSLPGNEALSLMLQGRQVTDSEGAIYRIKEGLGRKALQRYSGQSFEHPWENAEVGVSEFLSAKGLSLLRRSEEK